MFHSERLPFICMELYGFSKFALIALRWSSAALCVATCDSYWFHETPSPFDDSIRTTQSDFRIAQDSQTLWERFPSIKTWRNPRISIDSSHSYIRFDNWLASSHEQTSNFLSSFGENKLNICKIKNRLGRFIDRLVSNRMAYVERAAAEVGNTN